MDDEDETDILVIEASEHLPRVLRGALRDLVQKMYEREVSEGHLDHGRYVGLVYTQENPYVSPDGKRGFYYKAVVTRGNGPEMKIHFAAVFSTDEPGQAYRSGIWPH